VTSVPDAPPISRTLGFDGDYGVLAFIDDKGQPRRLDLRATEVRSASKEKLSALASVNGSDIYGVTEKGNVARLTPAGDWSFDPPSPARWVFPQPNGALVIAGNEGRKTSLWLIQPTDDEVLQTASLPLISRGVRTQIGDRIYFTVDSGLIGVRTRDLGIVKSIPMKSPVQAVVPTPSGDRLYVAMKDANQLAVIDRYTEAVTETVALPGPASELRMDPLGQNILARPATEGDSAWVIGVGSDRVNGTIQTAWRADLPGFAPGRTIATVRGDDVVFVDANSFAQRAVVNGGASDFWFFVAWNGFRPRPAELDRPVTFDTPVTSQPGDSTAGVTRNDSIPSPPLRDASPTMVEPPRPPATAKGYVVSFAAVLTEQKANETAVGISVNGVRPRVVQGQTGSTTIYRVVLGPYSSREEAERVGRDSRRPFWIYEESR
jgi:YVTN family beta-propeller protein